VPLHISFACLLGRINGSHKGCRYICGGQLQGLPLHLRFAFAFTIDSEMELH
jgi:hypothetical protein